MKRSSGARIAATLTVSALSLALITGCSDNGSDDAKGTDAKESAAASSAPAAKALTSAELEKLLLAKGDVKDYEVESGDDTLPKSKSDVKTDKAQCDPLAWATAALAPGETDANASNTVTANPSAAKDPSELSEADIEGAFDVSITFVGLSSYDGDGAEKALKAVSDGVTACSGGYGLKAEGENSKVTKVTTAKSSGAGDESVAFAEDVDMDGEGTATFLTEVVRKGNTVATFYSVNLAALSKGGKTEIPADVVKAQVAKLK
ncbi:hypothetical protein DI272_28650 [Streptomyces sp. Act143]|uniref:hypothetical protein n=1 Tax=Streptomyces sp. Act143 TaxID=2200760 RepID=UPI000D677B72|nr:hypothetical protein [Streptomyces sp. Act143]PWI17691.1 hypothetical protein DI272_28650 [Streptomyces sp. Act143]